MRTLTLTILALMALAIVPTAAAQENDGSSFRKAFIRIQRQKAFKTWREQNAPRLAQMTKAELRQMKHEKLSFRNQQTASRMARQDGSRRMGPHASDTPRAWAKSAQGPKSDKRNWVSKANKKNSIWSKDGRRAAKTKDRKTNPSRSTARAPKAGTKNSIWSKDGRRAAKTKDRKTKSDRSVTRAPKARRAASRPQRSTVGKAERQVQQAQPSKEPVAKARSRDAHQRDTGSKAETKAERNNARPRRSDTRINEVVRSNDKAAKASTRKLMRTRQWSRQARESTTAKKAAKFRARHDARVSGNQGSGNQGSSNQGSTAPNVRTPKASTQQARSAPAIKVEAKAPMKTPVKAAAPERSMLAMPKPAPKKQANTKPVDQRVKSAASTLLSAPPPRDDDQDDQ